MFSWCDTITKHFRPRHQRERRAHLKQWHHNQNTTSRKPKGQFLSRKMAKQLSKIKISLTYIQRYTRRNDRNSKPQQKNRLGTFSKNLTGRLVGGGGEGEGYNPRPKFSRGIYTRQCFSSCEGFLTHQCNISKNIRSSPRTFGCLRACAKCADSHHSAYAQSRIRAFALQWNIL